MGYALVILGTASWIVCIAMLVGVWWLRSEPEFMRCRTCGYNLDGVHRRSRACPECGGRRRGIAGLTRGEANCGRVLAVLLCTASGLAGYKLFGSASATAALAPWTNPVSVRFASDREVLRAALAEWPSVSPQTQPYLTELKRRLRTHVFTPGSGDPLVNAIVEELTAAVSRRDPGIEPVSRAVIDRALLARQNGEIDAGQLGRVLAIDATIDLLLTPRQRFDGEGLLEREWSYELSVELAHIDPGWRCWLRGGGMRWEALDMFPYRGDLLHFSEQPIDGSSRADAPVELFENPYRRSMHPQGRRFEGGSGTITLSDGANYRATSDLTFELYEPTDMGANGPYAGAQPVAVVVIARIDTVSIRNAGGIGFPFRLHR